MIEALDRKMILSSNGSVKNAPAGQRSGNQNDYFVNIILLNIGFFPRLSLLCNNGVRAFFTE
jgi:hypothetical protein